MQKVQNKILTGAQITVQTLKVLGVDRIFGYPGSAVLDVYDELSKQSTVRHYLVRHEQAAVHCAEGYAKLTGRVGVVLVTSGPGATNTLTGIANAHFDGTPLVILTGQIDKSLLGKNSFQEVDIVEMTKTITKAGLQVKDASELEKTLIEAFEIAQSGRKGPVVIDIPQDVFSQNAEYKNILPSFKTFYHNDFDNLHKIEELIDNSTRPLIICGAGVLQSKAENELYQFAQLHNIPIVSTMLGMGAYSKNSTNFFGMLGIYGSNAANEVFRQADLLIVLGARLNDRITSAFDKNCLLDKIVIQVDINPNELGRNMDTSECTCADIKEFLSKINVKPKSPSWLNSILILKNLDKEFSVTTKHLSSSDVIKEIYKYAEIVTTEVGQHQIFAIQYLPEKVKMITSGGFGTMGFGFPAAIGAATASKNPVVCIAGDGSIQMNIQELATLKEYNLPVKVMILNNGYLGMVRQLQKNNFNENYFATKLINPDFTKLAESYGIEAIKVTQKSQLESAVKKAFSDEKPFLIDFIVEPLEEV